MATTGFPITPIVHKNNCIGFVDSKTRNKHYKAHCLGIPANKVGAGDMKGKGFQSAQDYESHGCNFLNGPLNSFQWQVLDRDGNIARWDSQTGEFAVQRSLDNRLLTYHLRSAHQFAAAAFDRAVTFYAEGSKGAQGTEGQPGMGTPNEWVLETHSSEFDTSDY